MKKRTNPAKRAKKREKSRASGPLPSPVAKRGRLWVIPLILAIIVIGLVMIWAMRDRPRPMASSSPPPSPAARKHITVMLDSQAQKIPQTVLEIQEEELALAEALVRDFPKNDVTLALLGKVHQSRGDTARAQELWEQAIALNPNRSDLYKTIGETAQGKDQLDEAISWWQQGLKANAQTPGLRWLIANALVTQGHLDTTLELLEAERVITPGAARNPYLIGQVHLKQRAYKEAEAAYSKAIKINPHYYNAYYGLGMVYTRLKQPERARTAMAQFRQLKARTDASEDQQIMIDEVPYARKRIAMTYAQAYKLFDPKQQAEIGARLLSRALELDSRNALLWEKMATHNYANGRYEHAVKLFKEAARLEPEKPIYAINIGKLYAQMNRIEQAQAALQKAVARFPESSLARTELAHHYLRSQTHYVEALALMKKAVALTPTANHYFLLTWAYDVNGDQKKALTAIQKALAMEPQNPKYRSTYERIRSRR
jgi:tetratricopeptide (TPR) repeat protein